MMTGRMNRRIILQSYEKTAGWVQQAIVWAEFRTPQLKTADIAGNMASELFRDVNIRYRRDVKKGWRVVYDHKSYDIMHTYEFELATTTTLVCREVVL